MLWLEKYRPKDFENIKGHEHKIELLKKYNLDTIPHLIFHGRSGSGKKTLVLSLIGHLFNEYPKPKLRTTEIKLTTRTVEVSFLESNEYIEICPSDYNYQDKTIIQTIIKEMAQSKPVMSFFTAKNTNKIKFIVITSAHDLSLEAQAALRRTIEVYSETFRIILICNQLSRIIEPIRSRCVNFRIRGYTDVEINNILQNIVDQENSNINKEEIKEIINMSNNNIRRAICYLELLHLRKNDEASKRQHIELSSLKLEWEAVIDTIIAKMKSLKGSEAMIEIRKLLFQLINSCIPPKILFLELYRRLICDDRINVIHKIVDLALIYEERLRMGNKGIYHIEAFIIGSICILKEAK